MWMPQPEPDWLVYTGRRWWSIYSHFPAKVLAAYTAEAVDTRNSDHPFRFELHRVDLGPRVAWVVCSPDPYPWEEKERGHDQD